MTDRPDQDPIIRVGPDERDYLLERAEAHRVLAEQTTEAGAKAIHQRFCQLYEERAATMQEVVSD